MPLTLPPETTESFLQAARSRFAEGTSLLNAGHTSGAVYLFGYVGELTVKAIAYRHFSYGPRDPIKSGSERKSDRKAIEQLIKDETFAPVGAHDILKWAKWVVLKKGSLTGVPYPHLYGFEIENRANFIDTQWTSSLRYHALPIPFTTALEVQATARWFLTEEPNM